MVFTHEGISYDIIVTKKDNKHLYIRVGEDYKVNVSCPYLYNNEMIEKVISENHDDIDKMIDAQKIKNTKKSIEYNCLLGKPINVEYGDLKRAKFDGITVIVSGDDMLEQWYRKTAKDIFKDYLDEAYEVFEEKIPYPKLKVRRMKTRWGVCNRKDNSVTLNLELIKKDQEYLNYVIVHELSHFVHFDHSKGFWSTVEKYCPDYKRVRKALKE